VAAYRLSVQAVIELRTEQRALSRRLHELPAELAQAEVTEADARLILLQAARGTYGQGEIPDDIQTELQEGRAKIEGPSR
jgi:hypothetical protein